MSTGKMNATVSFGNDPTNSTKFEVDIDSISRSGIELCLKNISERMQEWGKHHEHTADFDETKTRAKRRFQEAGKGRSEKNDKDKTASNGGGPAKRIHQQEPQKPTTPWIEDVTESEDEYIEDRVTEVSDIESITSCVSVRSSDVNDDGKLLQSSNKEEASADAFDVGAVAAMVGGLVCAVAFAWSGKGKKAKESMKIFTRGFDAACDKL
ncbi:hypothetical protein CXQ85_002548 [Candidozyma haemuli]|uniref:Uncharacterized protein n=1 Tax=Candidozyma haemuli TaxID=45357 RepID=A0A2V1AYE3_9ASCO|nr:hypothetical protein CXQ85_002548 [[Candida] haemuloni]PVH22824.1 hypothetical protein CXQ85_002548 [[Candida] haemuloni]